MNEGQQGTRLSSRFRMIFQKLRWRCAITHPNLQKRQSCYIGTKSANPCISMIGPRTVTGAQGCFVACVIFTRAKTARGTIARRGVLEKEKNEPRGMPWPALTFMQWPAEDRQNRINRSNTWRAGPADCRSQRNRQGYARASSVPQDCVRRPKSMQSRLLPSSAISCARMRERMSLVGMR